jgi:hypothetical protein
MYIERAWKIWNHIAILYPKWPTDFNSWKEDMTYLFSCLLCICGMFMYASRNIIYFIWVQKMEWGTHWGWVRKGCWGDEVNSRMKTLHNDYLHDFYSISDIIRMIKSQVWNPKCMWPSWVIQEMHTKYDSQNLHSRKQVRYLSWLLTLECNFEIGSGFAGVGGTFRCVLPVTDVHCILVTG